MYGIFSGGGDNNALHFSCMHFYYINTHITYNNTIIPFGKRRFFFWLKFSLLIFCWCNRAICGISTSRKNNEKVCHRTSSLVITGWWYNGNNNKNNTVEKQRERESKYQTKFRLLSQRSIQWNASKLCDMFGSPVLFGEMWSDRGWRPMIFSWLYQLFYWHQVLRFNRYFTKNN